MCLGRDQKFVFVLFRFRKCNIIASSVVFVFFSTKLTVINKSIFVSEVKSMGEGSEAKILS